jgi:23S rRNA (cytosine1962-C5)-methyltransferase
MHRPSGQAPELINKASMAGEAVVTIKGARRWSAGHPWIYRSDVAVRPDAQAGAVLVNDTRGRPLGWALWSPKSEISLRLLDRNPRTEIDARWWRDTIGAAIQRRHRLEETTSAFRLIHGEGDGLPSFICDRYDRWLVVQLMSAGLERFRGEIVSALLELSAPDGILARNDAPLRAKEGLPVTSELLHGSVPQHVDVVEHGVRYVAAPWEGQKTGAFLDQRENRAFVGALARGRALDCFSYHGSFALHLGRRADHVTALDISTSALARAAENCARNGLTNVSLIEANAFDYLRARDQANERFDTIVLDPPAFAKNRSALPAALRGYKEINLRAMRLLSRGGLLFTASCSFHVTKPIFLEMLQEAAADSGRRIALREVRGQPLDHPEVLTIPETGYIKGALLEALD